MSKQFDLVVVGGGPGGYVAAIRAAQLGMQVALVEREQLGGICLNWGCIPTKALLRSADVLRLLTHAESFGISAAAPTADLEAIIQRSRRVSEKLRSGVEYLMKKHGIEVLRGSARLCGNGVLAVEGAAGESKLKASHIILATGARAREFPAVPFDQQRIWSYREALKPPFMPKRMLIIGSGAIGVEFACFYRAMGAEVTVLEAQAQIMPSLEPELAKLAVEAYRRDGITLRAGVQVEGLQSQGQEVEVRFSRDGKRQTERFDCALVAIGVVANSEGLGLEHTAAQLDRGFVQVDDWLRTGEPGLYAIGDLVGGPCLAHKASHEAVLCVERIAGLPALHPLDKRRIPACIYTTPQIASVGLTQAEAQDAGYELRVGSFPLSANGKAIAIGETEGLVKTLFDARTGELLGAHMVGAEVTEMIQGYVMAMGHEATEESLRQVIYAHPTISESMHESVLDAFDSALHK